MQVLMATLMATAGAAGITVDADPSRYRQAAALNREGRRVLVGMGASASEAWEQVLIG